MAQNTDIIIDDKIKPDCRSLTDEKQCLSSVDCNWDYNFEVFLKINRGIKFLIYIF